MKVFKKIGKFISGIGLKVQFNIIIAILVVIPILLLGRYIFRNMDENTVTSAETYMEGSVKREETTIHNDLEAMQMATQYLLKDNTLRGVLRADADGTKLSTAELRSIYQGDIRQAQQLLYSNPALYSLRLYSMGNTVTEMTPVLYRRSRMLRQEWASKADPAGYYFDYSDNIYRERDVQDSDHLIALITPMDDSDYGRLGYVEAAIGIAYMFPEIYEPEADEEAFLVLPNGTAVEGASADSGKRRMALSAAETHKGAETISVKLIQNRGKNCVVSSLYIDQLNVHYVRILDLTNTFAKQNRQKALMLILFGAIIVVLIGIINTIVDWLLRDFYRILETVYVVQDGDISVRVPALREGETAVLGNEINTMLDEIDALMKENLEKGLMEKNTQIRALEKQINAHFIYNVLESINMMAEIDGEYAICDAVVALGDMLRYSLRWTKGMVTIADELNYVNSYVALMNIRLDGQLKLTTQISSELMKNEIPKMTLQPLVENAVTHAYPGSDEKEEILVTADTDGEKIHLYVIDDGCGMTKEELASLIRKMEEEPDAKQKHGYALHNIRERIRMMCGEGYGLSISSEEGKGTTVTVTLPRAELTDTADENN